MPDKYTTEMMEEKIEGLRATVEDGRRLYQETVAGESGPATDSKAYNALTTRASELIVDRLKEVWQERPYRKSAN
jgi:hypothetical protein